MPDGHHFLAEAGKIEKSLEDRHPHAEEVQILSRRLRVCRALQKIHENSANILAGMDEEEWTKTLKSLDNLWERFYPTTKSKICAAKAFRVLTSISRFQRQGQGHDVSDQETLQNFLDSLVEVTFPHLGHIGDWSAQEPCFGNLLQWAFLRFEAAVEALQQDRGEGDGKDESRKVDAAVLMCASVLQDPSKSRGPWGRSGFCHVTIPST